jgi:hypothetical protein
MRLASGAFDFHILLSKQARYDQGSSQGQVTFFFQAAVESPFHQKK